MDTDPKPKPLLRGHSHQAAFFVALGAGTTLLFAAPGPRALVAVWVYALSLMALFGVSALYHRIQWGEAARLRMKRLDHATIFVFIAGSYTPICLLALPPDLGRQLLTLVWAGAGLGVARAICWPRAPKGVTALLYIALGWAVVAYWPAVVAGLGPTGLFGLGLGGLLYSLGAGVYALKRPDPIPHVFGYHEVFHALVIIACISHFVVITRLVLHAAG